MPDETPAGMQQPTATAAITASAEPVHHNPCHVWNSGPATMASAIPLGMKQLHSEKALSRAAPVVRRSRIAGPATMMSRNPSPSSSREISSSANDGAAAPATPATAVTPSPNSRARRSPTAATTAPAAAPPSKPSTANMPVSQPAPARSTPRSACSNGVAMAALPKCRAATTPQPSTTQTTSLARSGRAAFIPAPRPDWRRVQRPRERRASPGNGRPAVHFRSAGGHRRCRHRPASRRHRACHRLWHPSAAAP